MAEVVGLLTSAVVKIAGDKLGSAIAGQANLLWNLSNNLVDMKEALESMVVVLKEAERRSIREEPVRLWLKRLKNAALDISDMLDEFPDTDTQATAKKPGILSCLSIPSKNIELANKLKKMRDELKKIDEQHRSFNLTVNTSASTDQQNYDRRETTSDVNEKDIIGRDGETQAIIDLLSASDNNDNTMILPIFGLGGIGKTTLARLVYNDTKFKKYDHRVWVYVSQVFDLKKIGRSMICQLQIEGSQQNNYDTLQLINKRLDGLLCDKKVLIVLDDIWEEKVTELEKLKCMLRVGKRGSMVDVIVTTRKEYIANKICTNEPYKLQPLKDDMCWDIIKRFSQFEHKGNKEQLKNIGLDIAKKCGGVALAAQALGYTLQSKDLCGWSQVKNSDIWNETFRDQSSPYNDVLPSLKLSYESMQPHLRLCFAYCAVFPKGHDIVKDDLIHQWIALDFIEPSMTLAEEYINQLMGMSFLQCSKLLLAFRKSVLRYTMHDLVHDLARSVMGDELLIFDAATKSNTIEQKYCRYGLLTSYGQPSKLSTILPRKVRALHFLNCSKLELSGGAFSFAKCLRILDFNEYSTLEFPASIGQLKNLRCLIAPRMKNKRFPQCITKLSKLQYLNLHESSQISSLPETIGKLGCLIHLDMSGCSGLIKLPESFGDLKNLLRLDLSNCSNLGRLPEAIGSLVELQYLNISGCPVIGELPESFHDLQNLVHLDVSRCSDVKGVPRALSGLTALQTLDISRLCSSTYREGSCSHLEGLYVLGNLTNLKYLNLSCTLDALLYQYSIRGLDSDRYIDCISALTNLEHLDLSWNCYLDYLPGSLGNLRRLHTLNVTGCRRLVSIPESINALKLKSLMVDCCSDELIDQINSRLNNYLLTLPLFMVRADDSNARSNLHQLENVNPDDLKIRFLENVRFLEEAHTIKLIDKKNLSKLTLAWTLNADRLLEDKDLMGGLVPPKGLKYFLLKGYSSISFPTWLMDISHYLPNLVHIRLNDLPMCSHLPPLGQLPNLDYLSLDNLRSISKISGDFCGGKGAFRRLSRFDLLYMKGLEWDTTYCGEDGVQEFMFPMLDELVIINCPKLKLKPCLPIFRKWQNFESDEMIFSWDEEDNISNPSSSIQRTKLEVVSKSACISWRLFHHLPTLQELEIRHSPSLMSLPGSIQHLASLRMLGLTWCESISTLPEWLGELTSLESLTIHSCQSITSLPLCIQQLTRLQKLHIEGNPELKQWCESEENKMKLAHIKDIIFEYCD